MKFIVVRIGKKEYNIADKDVARIYVQSKIKNKPPIPPF